LKKFTQPTIHHVLYIESDSLQLAKYGFFCAEPKSFWVSIDTGEERERLDKTLARLHKSGYIKLYIVSACMHGDDSSLEEMFEELDALDGFAMTGGPK